jgi:KDO2-lipid IV(A) lauroyltransferase
MSDTPPLPDRHAPTLRNRLLNAWEILLYQVFRRLPIDLAPRLSARSTVAAIRRDRPRVVERARANLRRHRPDASEAEIEASVAAFLDNIGRIVGETACVGRFMAAGRIDLPNAERTKAIRARGGLLALCLHTGNWDLMLEGVRALGMSVANAMYVSWESPAQTWIINDMRRRAGMRFLRQDRGGERAAYEELKTGGLLAVFVDEARDGRLMAPLFGRPPHTEGNLAIAAKLARRTGCSIVLCNVTRLPEGRFRVNISDAIALPESPSGVLDDVAFLNAIIEPVVLDHLDQWFWLDDAF